ncbi:hypothetical protein [uncultured Roseobacter sp.]|uniref:hypothetical protein n=1 Tax=uncultured Roseobacter sp. TaxID=114847 RepID=UPI00262E28F1|nr:hypothetical protein [uncultured Roseobacter sp.]
MSSLPRDLSLQELELIFGRSAPTRIMWDWIKASDHSKRRQVVESAINFIASEISKHRQGYQSQSEDQITIHIVLNLKSMGFVAVAHDVQFGGHCDIAVEGADEFLWLAEAKVHRDYNWLIDGTKQLLTRYATGSYGQDAADVLVYYFGQNARNFMEEWHARMAKEYPDAQVAWCCEKPEDFRTVHMHRSSGAEFHLRHKVIPLFFKPEK